MSNFTSYIVHQGDTLEQIAATYLGNASRWQEIATLNMLHYPFISDDPRQRLGYPLLETRLSQAFNAGGWLRIQDQDATSVAVADLNHVLLEGRGGQIRGLFADETDIFGWGVPDVNTGMRWSSSVSSRLSPDQLAAFTPGVWLWLTTEPQHSYAAGSVVRIYKPDILRNTGVAKTGDTLRVPYTTGLSPVDLTSFFGTDIVLDGAGQLAIAGRDIAAVTGTDNLKQAITIRLTTEVGELSAHPEYGNQALAYVGRGMNAVLAIAYTSMIQSVRAEPRVGRVTLNRMVPDNDVLHVDMTIQTADRGTLISFTDFLVRSSLP